MNLPTVFETCESREDVLKGTIAEADFAADLAKVIRGIASDDYQKPDRFFANTFPTQGLKNLLRNVMGRLTGDGAAAAAIFRLDTSYGGGKTHGLIAQVALLQSPILSAAGAPYRFDNTLARQTKTMT
jgi:predicted AAA+ superfamily ATPase